MVIPAFGRYGADRSDPVPSRTLEQRVTDLIRVKYAYDNRWNINGRLVARALLLPGCAVCRAMSDRSDRERAFLLHERVNDPETVVRLIQSQGFCPAHLGLLRAQVVDQYADDLKVILLYGHLVDSLSLRLERRRLSLDELKPTTGCPSCAGEATAEREALDWVIESLEFPELRAALAERDDFCLAHVMAAELASPNVGIVLSEHLRAEISALARDRHGWTSDSITGARIALLLGGGWPDDLPSRPSTTARCPTCRCPTCNEGANATREELDAVASGGTFDGLPCWGHLRALRAVLRERPWPPSLVGRMVIRIESLLHEVDDHCQGRIVNRFDVLHRRKRPFRADPVPSAACPVCKAASDAVSESLRRVDRHDLANDGCLHHLVVRAERDRIVRGSLIRVLTSRVKQLTALRNSILEARRETVEERHRRTADAADEITAFFAHPFPEGAALEENGVD